VANETLLCDLQILVRCKAVTGTVDQACGVVFRYADENNYYARVSMRGRQHSFQLCEEGKANSV
jgi:hypothetical protein